MVCPRVDAGHEDRSAMGMGTRHEGAEDRHSPMPRGRRGARRAPCAVAGEDTPRAAGETGAQLAERRCRLARVSQSADVAQQGEEGATMPKTLSDQTLQHLEQHTSEMAQLADELADVIAQAGMEQQHSTSMDSRCARIKQLCQDMRAVVGAGPGR